MYDLIIIILLVFGFLQIVLFFKIWIMTDDIRQIKNKYLGEKNCSPLTVNKPQVSEEKENFEVGDLVVRISDGKQLKIKGNKDGKYICTSYFGEDEGCYNSNEIKRFFK